jgi:hypothetical protein
MKDRGAITGLCGKAQVKICKIKVELKHAVLVAPCRNECPFCLKKCCSLFDTSDSRIDAKNIKGF